ncbi:MAG: phospholipase D family protein, partial [Chitinophagaceae bacterium]|nr:phospholipase D family protein [Rubrivivax sp.]
VLDQSRIFIGSMNFDPRSEHLNTELGLLIDSPAITGEFLSMIDFRGSAYRLRLTADGHGIEWVASEGAAERVEAVEPESSLWIRFKLWLLSPLIPERHL